MLQTFFSKVVVNGFMNGMNDKKSSNKNDMNDIIRINVIKNSIDIESFENFQN